MLRLFICLLSCLLSATSVMATSSTQLAEQMDSAKSLSTVFGILIEMRKSKLSDTEKLMIFDRIPKSILDVSASLERLDQNIVYPQDLSATIEMIYLVALQMKLDSLVTSPFRIRSQRFIKKEFIDLMNSMSSRPHDSNTSTANDELEKNKPKETAVSYTRRLEAVAQALALSLPKEQISMLLEKRKLFKHYDWKIKNSRHLEFRSPDKIPGILNGSLMLGLPLTLTMGMMTAMVGPEIFLTKEGLFTIAVDLTAAISIAKGDPRIMTYQSQSRTWFKHQSSFYDAFFNILKRQPAKQCALSAQSTLTSK